jgi:hypothetical protein
VPWQTTHESMPPSMGRSATSTDERQTAADATVGNHLEPASGGCKETLRFRERCTLNYSRNARLVTVDPEQRDILTASLSVGAPTPLACHYVVAPLRCRLRDAMIANALIRPR